VFFEQSFLLLLAEAVFEMFIQVLLDNLRGFEGPLTRLYQGRWVKTREA
jgi:hypothetical protein